MGGIEEIVQRDLLMDQLELSFLMRKRREEYIIDLEDRIKKYKKKTKKLKKKIRKLSKKKGV
jgi:prefoldin subunit 5|tara:strand:- start:204 stop:389 length:186 start_codon:yes stop_codon:yes gene_type:complete